MVPNRNNLLGPPFVISFEVNLFVSELELDSKTSAQASRHQIGLNNNMTVWVNQIAILIDVKTNKRHSFAVLVEEYVRM